MTAHRISGPTAIHRRVAQLRAGEEPTVVARTISGWIVLGERQVVRGYCLILPDPVVPSLNDLDGQARARFLEEMGLLGDALLRVTGAARINYEILGNLEPALHAHVIPRRADEPPDLRTRPIWSHDWASAPAFDPELYGSLREAIVVELRRLGVLDRMRSPG